MVEKQWRAACKTINDTSKDAEEDPLKYTVSPVLPNDAELSSAFVARKKRSVSILKNTLSSLLHSVVIARLLLIY